MKISLTLAGVVLLGTSLAACGGGDSGGGGDTGSYCDELKSAKSSISKVSSSDFAALDDAIASFHKIADVAPSDVKADWETIDGAFVKVEKAFDDAGIKLSDLGDIQAGKIPEGADMTKLASLGSTFSEISSDKVTKAQANIEKHAKDTCNVELGTS